jgi:aspartyl-tRNA(Asn)/glutamyl-tRNA(Gln) amidotransferase subunit C
MCGAIEHRWGARCGLVVRLARMAERLTTEQVGHVARLARLRLTGEAVERYRAELSAVLTHMAMLRELDVSGVKPLCSPHDATNRLAEDANGRSLPLEVVLRNAPAVEGAFIAVPKVLGDIESGSAA